ncbi:MAG: GNAT family N-acetyltransferase/peptidase C39 family protein [Oceanospirillaceae bacterium]|nr:GNAT family N-acetyltransferase/peptidase C39 family protein [Oceanospirillaceae bacterium]MCP5335790.1 GNAT family N-acetyltransferase/peptidase C39 family protein [Oceanospirillaceae bacterium]MCP5349906.1 GNAT family N-acetyltransferase/peptidase C39 family protein [Oceanospirillaceae bacterium]
MTFTHIRLAGPDDIDALVALEDICFQGDKLSRRSFKRFCKQEHGNLWVHYEKGVLLAYVLVLFNQGTSMARVYSLAVHPICRGRGVARQMMLFAEQATLDAGFPFIRLEVRSDNKAAQALYQQLNYHIIQKVKGYYEDGADGLRMEKALRVHERAPHYYPYYAQTTEFTCGPASLLMALRSLRPKQHWHGDEELAIWREATTIFMTSGHGGCGPHGLALAAQRRGLLSEIYLNQKGTLFTEGVRQNAKKSVLERVHEQFEQGIANEGIPLHYEALSAEQLAGHLAEGKLVLLLISSYRFTGQKAPHWVLVTHMNDKYFFWHDPDVDDKKHETELSCINVPVPLRAFNQVTQFGKTKLRAAVVLGPVDKG